MKGSIEMQIVIVMINSLYELICFALEALSHPELRSYTRKSSNIMMKIYLSGSDPYFCSNTSCSELPLTSGRSHPWDNCRIQCV